MTLGIFLVLIQILISGYVNIWPMLYIAVFPLILIILPQSINSYLYILLAFLLGLVTDITSDGIMGLNAAATTALAFFRKPVINMMINKSSLDNLSGITDYTIGTATFFALTAVLYSIFFIFYMTLDSLGFYSMGYTILRFAINVLTNTALVTIFSKALTKQLFIK